MREKLKMKEEKGKMNGFTLVELLVVVAIIGILAAALLIGINPLEQTRKARDAGLLSKCKEAIGAAERYYAFFNTDPASCAALETAQELKSGSCTGITLVSSSGSYTCTFTNTSQTYRTKCIDTTCTVPTEF